MDNRVHTTFWAAPWIILMAHQTQSFQTITTTAGVDIAPPRTGWQSVVDVPLLLLVGVTGVGKSTTLARLSELCEFTLLPDRRTLTDALIIAEMQAAAGLPICPVQDRAERFAYTRRYQEQYAGGMAYALAQLQIRRDAMAGALIFDGLRGENEVKYAAGHFPNAHFALLDAPDLIRIQRLLSRSDDFDQISPGINSSIAQDRPELALPEAVGLLTPAEVAVLLSWAEAESISLDDLRAKLSIVASERRNYDPAAARSTLARLVPERTLHIDTTEHGPKVVAEMIADYLDECRK